jgi:hypothetical protein
MPNSKYNLQKKLYEAKKARDLLDEEFTEFTLKVRSIQEFFEMYNSEFYKLLRKTHEFFTFHSLNYIKEWINPRIITKRGLEQQIREVQTNIDSIEQTHPIIPNGSVITPNPSSEWDNLDEIDLFYIQSNQKRKIHGSELYNNVKDFLKKTDTSDSELLLAVDNDVVNDIRTGKDIKVLEDIYDSNYDINTYNTNITTDE